MQQPYSQGLEVTGADGLKAGLFHRRVRRAGFGTLQLKATGPCATHGQTRRKRGLLNAWHMPETFNRGFKERQL